MSSTLPAAETAADAVIVHRHQRFQHPSRHRQRLRAARPPTWCCCGRIFQMGIPVSGKNLFPSNIAGLPTWYTIRANHRGYIGRKKEIDFLVAMNPETAKDDVLALEPGGAVVYDEPLKLDALRTDLDLLSGAVRQDRRRGLHRRQAAPPRQEHDLRRRAGGAAVDRSGRDGEGADARSWARSRRRWRSTWARSRPARSTRPSTSRSATRTASSG